MKLPAIVSTPVRSFRLLRRRDRYLYVLLLVVRSTSNLLDMLGIFAVGVLGAMLANSLSENGGFEFLGTSIPKPTPGNFLILLLIFVSFFVAKSIFSIYLQLRTTRFLARVEAEFTEELAEQFFVTKSEAFRSYSKGEIQWLLTTSSSLAFSGLLYAYSVLLTEASLFLIIMATFFVADSLTALGIAAYFALFTLLFNSFLGPRTLAASQVLTRTSVRVVNAFSDGLAVLREAKLLGKSREFSSVFAAYRRDQAAAHFRQRFFQGLAKPVTEITLMLGLLLLVGFQYSRNSLGEGLIVTGVILAGAFRLAASVIPIQNSITDLKTLIPQASGALTELEKVRSSSASDSAISTASRGSVLERAPRVEFAQVSFSYDPGVEPPALSKVSFTCESGTMLAIAGESGAGKSTLAMLMMGNISPDEGEILIDGRSPREFLLLSPGILGYVPQTPQLISGSLRRNIVLSEKELSPSEADFLNRCIQSAGLGPLVQEMSRGLETELGPQLDTLSGGQIQRLGLARALFGRPRLLIVDEISGPLDVKTERLVVEDLRRMLPEVTIVSIAHRPSTIEHADNVLLLDSGKNKYFGSFKGLKELPSIFNDTETG